MCAVANQEEVCCEAGNPHDVVSMNTNWKRLDGEDSISSCLLPEVLTVGSVERKTGDGADVGGSSCRGIACSTKPC